ncbi:SMI1/KNR4 family protein [Tenacibaculum sp. 190524A05c]|uniref:SMI1/KNR4 family protein n=1 Tax=Tenacibaculum platacis TaxID=3137852 RepID=UPI0032B2131B
MKEFNNYYDNISTIELEELEKLIGARLPSDYKEHMLKFNGGKVPHDKDYIINYNNQDFFLSGFYTLKHGVSNIEDYYNNKHSFLYPKLLPIGVIVGGYLALGYKEENYGEVYVYFSDSLPFKVANSFGAFIDNIEEQEADI